MGSQGDSTSIDKDVILDATLKILGDLTSDWDAGLSGPIGPTTRLAADLGLESIHMVHLVVALSRGFSDMNCPFMNSLRPIILRSMTCRCRIS